MQSVQGFHAVMNLLLMPMWVLSSSFFPAVGAPLVLKWAMMANPLTYGVIALRHSFYLSDPRHFYEAPGFGTSLLVMVIFSGLVFLAATRMAARVTKGDLQ
jgi:ABC-type polysaccharide/polyol phosphate export permease